MGLGFFRRSATMVSTGRDAKRVPRSGWNPNADDEQLGVPRACVCVRRTCSKTTCVSRAWLRAKLHVVLPDPSALLLWMLDDLGACKTDTERSSRCLPLRVCACVRCALRTLSSAHADARPEDALLHLDCGRLEGRETDRGPQTHGTWPRCVCALERCVACVPL